MTTEEKLFLASKVFDKGWDFETFCYTDESKEIDEDEKEEIWDLVEEISDYGVLAFKEKHNDIKLYF